MTFLKTDCTMCEIICAQGGENMTIGQMQELLLAMLPQWHYKIAKPFKQMLDNGVSLEMYYCIQMLRMNNNEVSMTEFARITKMPKQQMTKMVNKLIEFEFVERVSDPDDRRIIKLRITQKANEYINHFLEKEAVYYKKMFECMDEEKETVLPMLF